MSQIWIMGKKIILILLGVILVGMIIGALWVVGQRERDLDIPKESFIPYNSAVVFNIHANAVLSPELETIFEEDIMKYREGKVFRVMDSLREEGLVEDASVVLAFRVEGKRTVRSLYILNRSGLFSRGDVHSFLKEKFRGGDMKERHFDKFSIYTLAVEEQSVYFAVVGGMVLLSDSELYVEDALKQIDRENTQGEEDIPRYKNINRYLSASAGVNVFLNTSCFTDLLPLYAERKNLSRYGDFSKWFAWGALDVNLKAEGIGVNGFMQYGGRKGSFAEVLNGQQAGESRLEKVLPSGLKAAGILKLSEVKSYLTALEKYRLDAGFIEKIRTRKQEYTHWFGKGYENRWQELLQGEFAKGVEGVYSLSSARQDAREGMILVYLKSGSLAETLLREMLEEYCRKVNINIVSLERVYQLDKDKKVAYYKWPVADFAEILWGDWLNKVPANYALIQDNYLVLASCESTLQNFVKDYVRHSSLSDTDWYKNMKAKLPAKYSWMYIADFPAMYAAYEEMAIGDFAKYLRQNRERLSGFSSLGVQWINEGDMVYQSLFLSTEEVEQRQAQVMWQTKLDANVTMKPVIVRNHNTGERELFVQDEGNTIYLINDIGRILWKQPVQGKINSEVYQVDYYKNGKLQYLFSTPTHLYLIDRNGEYLPRYPLVFKSRCETGITLYDYENDRNYRIFAPGEDRKIYLYDLLGNGVKGWNVPRCDNPMRSKVHHFRVKGKDYIVCADRYRVYVFDRKGNERAKVSTLFDLAQETMIYKIREKDGERLMLSTATGDVVKIDFDGRKVQTVEGVKAGNNGQLNVADLNNDGVDELIVGEKGTLSVYNPAGGLLQKNEWEGGELGYPYVYRFSTKDVRIGMYDRKQRQLLLMKEGQMSKGFPMEGTSPFSIAFFDKGDAGFYLFAAGEGGNLLKYQVQLK